MHENLTYLNAFGGRGRREVLSKLMEKFQVVDLGGKMVLVLVILNI